MVLHARATADIPKHNYCRAPPPPRRRPRHRRRRRPTVRPGHSRNLGKSGRVMRVMKTATKIYPKKEITENPVYPMLPQGQERLAALGISGTRPARQGPRRAGVLRRRLPRWARSRGALALCAPHALGEPARSRGVRPRGAQPRWVRAARGAGRAAGGWRRAGCWVVSCGCDTECLGWGAWGCVGGCVGLLNVGYLELWAGWLAGPRNLDGLLTLDLLRNFQYFGFFRYGSEFFEINSGFSVRERSSISGLDILQADSDVSGLGFGFEIFCPDPYGSDQITSRRRKEFASNHLRLDRWA